MMGAGFVLLLAALAAGIAAPLVTAEPNGLTLVAVVFIVLAVVLFVRARTGVPGE